MIDYLEELAARRDYKLKYIFTDCWCGLPTTILLHRFEDEAMVNKKNIKQWCGVHNFTHVTRPRKQCTKCKNFYEIETETCPNCEPMVRELTTLEVGIMDANSEILRLGRQLKRKKINDAQYTKKVQDLNDRVQSFTAKLEILNRDAKK